MNVAEPSVPSAPTSSTTLLKFGSSAVGITTVICWPLTGTLACIDSLNGDSADRDGDLLTADRKAGLAGGGSSACRCGQLLARNRQAGLAGGCGGADRNGKLLAVDVDGGLAGGRGSANKRRQLLAVDGGGDQGP